MAIHGFAAGSFPLIGRSTTNSFRDDVFAGLSGRPRTLPCKYFYDERGSLLFDRICGLPEYYLTRTELAIMRRHAAAIGAALGPCCRVIEYGSGSSLKTPLLLDALREPVDYVPVDISREHLYVAANAIARQFPAIDVVPLWADFTQPFELPAPARPSMRRAVYFPGSTIGNFGPDQACSLLKQIARLVGDGGALLIGFDLRKSASVIEPAYNDAQGVTAAFNLNLLARVNRELDGDFDLGAFEHRAIFNDGESRIEMRLFSKRPQVVRVRRRAFEFAKGESILTECSYKYTREAFSDLAGVAGFEVRKVWTDDQELFAVMLLGR
jgi:dimethylhistidine N-methyltransferase